MYACRGYVGLPCAVIILAEQDHATVDHFVVAGARALSVVTFRAGTRVGRLDRMNNPGAAKRRRRLASSNGRGRARLEEVEAHLVVPQVRPADIADPALAGELFSCGSRAASAGARLMTSRPRAGTPRRSSSAYDRAKSPMSVVPNMMAVSTSANCQVSSVTNIVLRT